jgi:hypothetical protein
MDARGNVEAGGFIEGRRREMEKIEAVRVCEPAELQPRASRRPPPAFDDVLVIMAPVQHCGGSCAQAGNVGEAKVCVPGARVL